MFLRIFIVLFLIVIPCVVFADTPIEGWATSIYWNSLPQGNGWIQHYFPTPSNTYYCVSACTTCSYPPVWSTVVQFVNESVQHAVNIDGVTTYSYTASVCTVDQKSLYTNSSCTDGIKNGTETGIDCGGSCPACDPCAGKKSIGGCNAFLKYCEGSPEYSQSALFLQSMPDYKEFGYFRTTTLSGGKYVCAAWYRDNTGKVVRNFSGSYAGVDPLITKSCVEEPVFNAMNNTDCDANGTTSLNGFDTKIYVDIASKTYKKMNESGILEDFSGTVKIDLPDGTSVSQDVGTGTAVTTDKDGKSTYVGLSSSSGIGYDKFESDALTDNSEFKALFSKFIEDMKASSFFSLPESLFKSFPSGGTPDISFDAGRYGQHTYNFSTAWLSIVPIFKGIVIIVFVVVSVKIIILKGGGG